MKTNRAVIVQCRLSSTRLPQKALKDLGGKPVLAWCLSAMHKVNADRYFVATDEESYPLLKPICDKYNFECFAGDLNDVLKRFCDLIKTLDVNTIIRATADNPFLFYEAAEESAKDFEERNKGKLHCDYLTWSGLPHGSGVEIFRADSLLKAAEETQNPYDHEHVGPALYNHTDKYNCQFIKAPGKYNYPELRTTIDTYSDYLRAVQIVNYLSDSEAPYSTENILDACNSKKVKVPVVLVPSVIKGRGTGHLHRCLTTALNTPFFVYISKDKTLEETNQILDQYYEKGLKKWQIIEELPDQTYLPLIITDTFELTKNQLGELSKNTSLISIDEGSKYTDYCDYLLDIIPSVDLGRISNLEETGFIEKPKNRKETKCDKNSISKILICLGGEDPAGFTIPAVNAIHTCYPEAKITAIMSDVNNSYVDYAETNLIEFVKPIPGLREKLYDFDLVVTHYGLTAFEAVYAGCGVILLPTTKLHKQLAEKYNFACISEEITNKSMLDALSSENLFPEKMISSEDKQLNTFITQLSNGKKMNCPICDKESLEPDKIIARTETKTYRRCQHCSMVYISFSTEENKKYQKQYFFEEYKKQYGKTYQEDFEAIKLQCKRRLSEIKGITTSLADKKVLDIGCAYGPFLSAAEDFKMLPFGTDISEDAVEYVNNELGIPASCAAFPQINVSEEFGFQSFDIVTMWYVIEHFKNLDAVLSKVSSIVKKGGIFAFSTPNGEGVSGTTNKWDFYKNSPSDHYTVWEASKASEILKKYGFHVVKIVSTGHHPERFPSIKKSDSKPGSLKWALVNKLSHVKKLGDTMEIYCKKIR